MTCAINRSRREKDSIVISLCCSAGPVLDLWMIRLRRQYPPLVGRAVSLRVFSRFVRNLWADLMFNKPHAWLSHHFSTRATTMLKITETSIRFQCPNGHKIRARVRNEGRTMPCPACQTPVVVGAVAVKPITESGAFRLIESSMDFEATPPPAPSASPNRLTPTDATLLESTPNRAKCPRCSESVDRRAQFCNHCHLQLGSANRNFKQLYKAALQSVMSRR